MTSGTTSPAPTTNTTAGTWFADCLRNTLRYGQMLAKDIPADKFCEMPTPTMNHPAFCYRHLAMYPNKALNLMGLANQIVERDGWSELFDAPAPCLPDAGKYPSKDEIIAHYVDRYTTALSALPAVKDEVFRQESPFEGKFKEMVPTIGSAVNFLLNNHHMLHLGQVSTWRRAAGLPSVM